MGEGLTSQWQPMYKHPHKDNPHSGFPRDRYTVASQNHPETAGPISARFPDLAGKTAIVSGASRGLGVGIAQFLGRQGMRLALAARSEDRGLAVAEGLSRDGVDCLWVTADVGTADGAQSAFEAALERFGAVDLLVNNAACLRSTDFLHLDEDVYHISFELNVRIVYELSLRVARHMVERGIRGNIVNISSVGGLRSHRDSAGYDASKGAMDALTRSMALDLAPHGIRVNAVAPGAVWSRATQADPARAEFYRKKMEGIPLGRFVTPEEIGAAVAFVASDAAAYITGQIIYVDGGLTTQLTPPGFRI